jgi:hypothetical protein
MMFWNLAVFLLNAVCVFVLSHKLMVMVFRRNKWV